MEPVGGQERLYEIFRAKDARFDGRFFVGVSSTGVYCRPVCRARLPKAENCAFFTTAAAAEAAGFRPCLLCRPELAPGSFAANASATRAEQAARLIEEDCGGGNGLEGVAEKLGCTARHLRRVFRQEFHVSPVQYQQTCRLLLAKNLLTGTGLSVLEVAMASGFGSLRRFNDAFRKQYHMPPSAFRKSLNGRRAQEGRISVLLGYRAPFRFQELLAFFGQRAIPGVEAVDGGAYRRMVRLPGARGTPAVGWIGVEDRPEKRSLKLTVSDALLPVLPRVAGRVRQMFDLYCDPASIDPVLSGMNGIRPGLYESGVRIPGCFDPFETAVRAVLGQQVTVRAASTLAGRLAQTYGTAAESGIPGLDRVFPSPEELLRLPGALEDQLGRLGVIAARSRTIEALARAFIDASITFDACADPEAEIGKLRAIRGVGPWTANYIAMRTMAWTDAFLETDLGVQKAMPGYSARELSALAERWRPWRSYATVSLWNSLAKGGN